MSEEYNWFLRHPEVIGQYAGEYIAIVGRSVVAHGKDVEVVVTEAQKHGEPLIHKVPLSDKELVV